jgi:hypothetical protein
LVVREFLRKYLKQFASEYLKGLDEVQKIQFFECLPEELVWKMAEGMPSQNTDITSGGKPVFIPAELIDKYNLNDNVNESSSGNSEVQESVQSS